MTCIVGIKYDNSVYIGGDTLGSNGYSKVVRSDEKVFRNGPFVMGFTSSYRMGQLLKYALVPPPVDETNLNHYMVVDFINAVRACLKEGGWQQTDDGQERGGTFIVGYKDKLFSIHGDFQVGINADGYDAVGCGENFALGSLHSTTGDPKVRIRKAIAAAAHNSTGVGGPVTILKTKEK